MRHAGSSIGRVIYLLRVYTPANRLQNGKVRDIVAVEKCMTGQGVHQAAVLGNKSYSKSSFVVPITRHCKCVLVPKVKMGK